MKRFKKLCFKPQKELKKYLVGFLSKYYDEVIKEDGFIFAKGDIPILLTAHMDTVHKEQCSKSNTYHYLLEGKQYVTSTKGIGGDDRCGIWIITKIIHNTKLRPTILFCEDEEIGGVGSNKFVQSKYINEIKDIKYMIELDRANSEDAVFYDCGNKEFQEYICNTTGYEEAYGTFSDISHLSPAVDIASVNLSCGYYKAHTTNEYVCMEEMETTYVMVQKLLQDEANVEQFDYQKVTYKYSGYYGNWYGNYKKDKNYGYGNLNDYYDDYYDNYYGGYYGGYYSKKKSKVKADNKKLYSIDYMFDTEEFEEQYAAVSEEEALGMFFKDYPMLCYDDVLVIYEEDLIETETEEESNTEEENISDDTENNASEGYEEGYEMVCTD